MNALNRAGAQRVQPPQFERIATHGLGLAFRHFERVGATADGRLAIDGGKELIDAALLDESVLACRLTALACHRV